MPSSFIHKLLRNIKKLEINWKIALLFSAILPTLNLINNSQQREFNEWHRIVGNWTLTFLFLLSSWVINAVLYQKFGYVRNVFKVKRLFFIILINGLLLSFFVIIVLFLFNNFELTSTQINRNFYLIAFRGFISVVLIYLIQFTLYSNRRSQEVSMQNQMLKTENLRARFEMLRQQVNPHFLFNSLSTLRSMIHTGNDNSEMFVLKLSEIYRKLLNKQEKELVTLKEELEFIDDYSFMLFTRFENRLTIQIDVREELLIKSLPTFSLQILLENCVKHNVISENKPLHIKIFNSGVNYLIVENNLQPKFSPEESSGFGLKNLIKRYELLNEKEAVGIFSDDLVYRVKIKLLDV
jgi:two-component system, LytTR family, sensor kinase